MNKPMAGAMLVFLLVIAILLYLLLQCCKRSLPPRVVVHDPAVELMAEGGECPHGPTFEVPLSDTITSIPEYHDCQRFIVRDATLGEQYDSLYAIFASFTLRTLTDTIDSANTATSIVAIPAATIYSYGGSYKPLDIEDGFNCLYLWRRGDIWRAWIVNNGPDKPTCPSRFVPSSGTPAAPLNVRPRQVDGFGQSDYPPVARWEWDPGHGVQYIGIACGAAWCEVSRDDQVTQPPAFAMPSFSSPPGLTGTGPSKPERVQAIRGWHDAQQLAVRRNGKTVPSDVWAVVIPHPRLMAFSKTSTFTGDWVQVATIVASDDYDGAVLSLRKGSRNTIWLCYGSADDCDLPQEQLCETQRSTARWWGKTEHGVGQTATVEYRCVANVDHPPPPDVPATARWRWLGRDETTWTRCDNGCCKLQ